MNKIIPITLGPVHMEVGDPGEVRYPAYPWSKKASLHMQPRGAGVRLKNAFLKVLIFLTVLFVQGLFRLSGAFRPKFIEVINR